MDADAKLDATLRRNAGVALDHAVLHLDGAAHGVDHAAELNEAPVAGALHHPPVMHGDGGVDQIAPERPQSRQCAILVGAGKPAVPDDIGGENCSEFPGLGHDVHPATTQTTTKTHSELASLTETPSHWECLLVADFVEKVPNLKSLHICQNTNDIFD